MIVDVALDIPQIDCLQYELDCQRALNEDVIGQWVLVELRSKLTIGLIFRVCESIPKVKNLKKIIKILSNLPKVNSSWLRFINFTAIYYHKSLGQVIFTCYPNYLRDPKRFLATQKIVKAGSFDALLREPQHNKQQTKVLFKESTLNPEQKKATGLIMSSSKPILLHGVTGSGKTRVYLSIIKSIFQINQTAQILFLVPEISLTPQLEEIFRKEFPNLDFGVFNSSQTQVNRSKVWLKAARGHLRLILGTRMAIFLPLPNLELIVVDEEHDSSYKQVEGGLRYSARDLAIWRASKLNIKIILGSATPSSETFLNSKRNKFKRVLLKKQASGSPHAELVLVKKTNSSYVNGLSEKSVSQIKKILKAGKQTIIFLNRKGWAPVMICKDCGSSATCKFCSANTVLHKNKNNWVMKCHFCGDKTPPPSKCTDCLSENLVSVGIGTENLAERIGRLFPEAKILRLDREAIRGRKALQDNLKKIRAREVDIIIGTQMLTKGHDFSEVSLVVVVEVDAYLRNPDFRSPEKLFQSLIQVAGRAGRRESLEKNLAKVFVEATNFDSSFFDHLRNYDYDNFIEAVLKERSKSSLPPFTNFATIRLAHKSNSTLSLGLESLMTFLKNYDKSDPILEDVLINGPLPVYPEKISNRYRGQVILESNVRSILHKLLKNFSKEETFIKKFNASIDIDPIEI